VKNWFQNLLVYCYIKFAAITGASTKGAGARAGAAGGRAGGTRRTLSPTRRGGRMYAPEPRPIARQLDMPWRRPRPPTATTGRKGAEEGRRGGLRSEATEAPEDGVDEDEDVLSDWGELLATGGGGGGGDGGGDGDEDDGGAARSGASSPWDGVPGERLPSPMIVSSLVQLPVQEEQARQKHRRHRPGSARPRNARITGYGGGGGGAKDRTIAASILGNRPGSTRTAMNPRSPSGGGCGGKLSSLAMSMGLPSRPRDDDDGDADDVGDVYEDDEVDDGRGAPSRPRPVPASLLQPRHSRPVSAAGDGGGGGGSGAADTTNTNTGGVGTTTIRAGRGSESGGYAWRGGAPGLWWGCTS
jgi:hypothetical protein